MLPAPLLENLLEELGFVELSDARGLDLRSCLTSKEQEEQVESASPKVQMIQILAQASTTLSVASTQVSSTAAVATLLKAQAAQLQEEADTAPFQLLEGSAAETAERPQPVQLLASACQLAALRCLAMQAILGRHSAPQP